jgi:hypothetical protein
MGDWEPEWAHLSESLIGDLSDMVRDWRMMVGDWGLE